MASAPSVAADLLSAVKDTLTTVVSGTAVTAVFCLSSETEVTEPFAAAASASTSEDLAIDVSVCASTRVGRLTLLTGSAVMTLISTKDVAVNLGGACTRKKTPPASPRSAQRATIGQRRRRT